MIGKISLQSNKVNFKSAKTETQNSKPLYVDQFIAEAKKQENNNKKRSFFQSYFGLQLLILLGFL